MLVSVSNNCVGCGACATVNPEVFEMYGNRATVNENRIDGAESTCIDAALNCPVSAIYINDST